MADFNQDLKGLRICFLGHYDINYVRNRVIMKSMKLRGAVIEEVHSNKKGINRWIELYKKSMGAVFDLIWVGFLGHTDVPLAKIISLIKKKPLIFDAFVSLYEASVLDRKLISAKSFAGFRTYMIDWLACHLADLVIVDTKAHVDYFIKEFKVNINKIKHIYVGTDDEIMINKGDRAEELDKTFKVFFYGTYIPLHGIEYIIEAALILQKMSEDIAFTLVGSGQTYDVMKQLAEQKQIQNIKFLPKVSYEELPGLIAAHDVCLGIFGITQKAYNVIPNKVFDAIAMGLPIITADTPAIREVFEHGKNIYLVPTGDAKALANAIITLKSDINLRKILAVEGYKLFKKQFSLEATSENVSNLIRKVAK
jgi:glycosyltransferase involved in cell wall biosynthesis